MKKTRILVTAVLAIATLAISWKVASDNAAVHITDFNCWLYDGTGNLVKVDASGNAVITNSGNHNVKCQTTGLTNPTGQAIIYNAQTQGVPCAAAGKLTTDWQEVVSASGNATLICNAH